MHIVSHILSGWSVANLLPLTPRQRLFCMIAASVQDIDGLGRLVSEEAYWALHHKFGHSMFFGLGLSIGLTTLSNPRRPLLFLLYLALFHLHVVLDMLGSGPHWDIFYLWPISDAGIPTDWEWAFFS